MNSKKSLFKAIIYAVAAAVAASAVLSFSGCRSSSDNAEKGRDEIFGAVLSESPATLDPQTCHADSSAQIIACIFRGLYRITDGGMTVPDLAREITVSENGLEWEFELYDGVYWYGKDGFKAQCTADDFVFAFRRLMNPSLHSPHASKYYFIKNAKEINTGKISDLSALGVEATDKLRLKITFCEQRTDIEALLAAPPAMPCCKEFFDRTQGQYGLVEDCVGSNGDFFLNKWFYDKWMKEGNFITLRRNTYNHETSPTAPYAIKFDIGTDAFSSFTAEDTQTFRTADPVYIDKLSGSYEHREYDTAVWGLIFNSSGVFSSADLRIALGASAKVQADSRIYTAADRIVPDAACVGSMNYREQAGNPDRVIYSSSELSQRYSSVNTGLNEGALSGIKLLIPDGTGLKELLGPVLRSWQKDYGFYCAINETDHASYLSALSSGSFDIAAVRLSGGAGGAVDYLSAFSVSSVLNYSGVKNKKFEDMISNAVRASDDKTACAYCKEAETFLLDNCFFVPLVFEKEYVYFGKGVSGIGYDPYNGVFLYKNALKK